jgi:hypothetical protein
LSGEIPAELGSLSNLTWIFCGYMVLVKTGRERKRPVHPRQDM